MPQAADSLRYSVCLLKPRTLGKHGRGASPLPSITPSVLASEISFQQIWFPGADMSLEGSGAILSNSCLNTSASSVRKDDSF